MSSNPPRTTAIVWAILSFIFLAAIAILFTVDIGNAGFALIFVSIIMFITGVITSIIYGGRARKLTQLVSAEGRLVHWTYTTEEWSAYTAKEFGEQKSFNFKLFLIIGGIALAVGIIAVLLDPESGLWVLLGMVVLTLIIAFTAWFTAWYNHRQNIAGPGESYISREGVFISRQLHLWNIHGAFLRKAKYIEGAPPLLEFTYAAPTRNVIEERDVRVPVPKGEEAKARELLSQFSTVLGKKAD